MTLLKQLHDQLQTVASPERKASAEAYFKNAVVFIGASAPQTEQIFKDFLPTLKTIPIEARFSLGISLLDQDFFELQSLGTMVLHRDSKKFAQDSLEILEPILDRRATNWGTADTIAGRILRYRLPDAKDRAQITAWSLQTNPWKRRLACVAFVNEARKGLYAEEIRKVVPAALALDHRFVQLGAGWLLRERWRAAPTEVEDYLKQEGVNMRREALRYAIEKMPKDKQQWFLSYCK
jgi:3-methyladenine DNA glycosylase AlkD